MKTILTLFVAGMLAALGISFGHAQIIYSNNFSLGTATNIAGTPPTVANTLAGGTNTATWNDALGTNATTYLQANGYLATKVADSYLLPFTPQSGHIYVLKTSVTFTNYPGNWISFGFAQTYPTNLAANARFTDSGVPGVDWFIAYPNAAKEQFFYGPKNVPGTGIGNADLMDGNGVYPGTWTLQVTLDTTHANWQIAAFINDTNQLGSNYVYAANPTIASAGFGQNTLTAFGIQYNYLSLAASLQPFITRQPASQNLSAGAPYSNSVAVDADVNGGTLSYQWYTNGVPLVNGGTISGATSSTLVITPVFTNNAGTNYYVVVSNSSGSVTSSVVGLTVLQLPQLLSVAPTAYTNPITLFAGSNSSGVNYVGSTPTFSVSAVGAVPIFYQWLTNGVAVNGATNSSFTVTNCQLNSPTNFVCVVSNSFGLASNAWVAAYTATPQAPYPQAVLTDRPMAFWRLNETAGTLCHDYDSANNGIYTNVLLGQPGYNSLEPGETSVAFAPGSSALDSYAGRIQGVDFAAASGVNAEFTVEAWASGFGDVPGSPVVSEGTYAVNEEFGLGSDTNSTTLYQFYVRAANGTVYKAVSDVAVNDGNWHHLVGVCDEANSNVLLYVDGQLAASTAIPAKSGVMEASSPLVIGAGIKAGLADYTLEFEGNVSDVAAYNYALSGGQVVAHYASFGNAVPLTFVPPLTPANIVYQANQTLTVPAAISGAGPLGYYWTDLTAGGVLGSGQISGSGSLNATLTIPNAPAGLSGDQLELVANNADSSINLSVTLFSPAPPVTLDYTSPILYSNAFNGGTWSVTGTPMTAANSLVGGTNTVWVDALGTNDTGTLLANGTSATTAQDSWIVPFTPHAGYIYTINASLTFKGDPGSWVGLGFAQRVPTNAAVGYGRFADSGTAAPQLAPNGFDWLIMTESSGQLQYFAGPNTSGSISNKSGFFTAGAGTHAVQIVLDATGAQWKAYAYVDGVPAGTNAYNATNPPTIGAVGLTQTTLTAPGNVQWNSFALSQVAPGGVPPYLVNPLPANSLVLTNGTVTLPATVFGSAPFGYYWSNNSTIIASGSTNNMAPLSADLSVASSSLSPGQLQLVLTNAYGTNIVLVTLLSPINSNPGSIQYSLTGNLLTLSWPTNLGWALQAQTNSLAVGLSTNWVNIPNSTATNQIIIPVNPTNGSVFYRLTLP